MIELLGGTEVVVSTRISLVNRERVRILFFGGDPGSRYGSRSAGRLGRSTHGGRCGYQSIRSDSIRKPVRRAAAGGGFAALVLHNPGGDAGVVLSLGRERTARCSFESAPVTFSFSSDAVLESPTQVPAGGVGCRS